MSEKKTINRIPFEEIQTIETWSLPNVSGKKIKSGRRERASAGSEIIEEVRPEDLKAVTAEQLQKVVQDAENEGREKGYQEGLQQGFTEGEVNGVRNGEKRAYADTKAILDEKVKVFQQLADALLDPVNIQDQGLENIIMDMTVHFTKHLINRELSEDPSSVFKIVEQAVSGLPIGASNIRIHLNVDDVELAHEAFEGTGRQWTFYPDSELNRGGCRVESDQSMIDYSIESRLSSMLEKVDYQGDIEPDTVPPVGDYRPDEAEDVD